MFILHLRQNRVLPSMLACSVLLLLAAKPDNIISTRYLSKIGIKKVQGSNLDNIGGPKRWKVGLKSSKTKFSQDSMDPYWFHKNQIKSINQVLLIKHNFIN